MKTSRNKQKDQIKTIRRQQRKKRIQPKSRNINELHGQGEKHRSQVIDYKDEIRKGKNLSWSLDELANVKIRSNNKSIKFLNVDVEDFDDRILALEVKINVFLKPDFLKLSKQYSELSDRITELKEFKDVLIEQVDSLNDQFKMDVIDKFSNDNVVDKAKSINYNSIGVDLEPNKFR